MPMSSQSEHKYSVKEIFDSIQGEGHRTGKRSVFVRFVGCNMWSGEISNRHNGAGACAMWCDTDFRKLGSKKLTIEAIGDEVERLWPKSQSRKRWVVLTGGEPMLQVNKLLLTELKYGYGLSIAIETNGTTLHPSLDEEDLYTLVDHLCVSPKLDHSGNLPMLKLTRADELKIVLPGHSTNGWTPKKIEDVLLMCTSKHLHVQPTSELVGNSLVATGKQEGVESCLDLVKHDSRWTIGIQLHKVLGQR
jgi:7-carboxy-7-deazaguanine synthase